MRRRDAIKVSIGSTVAAPWLWRSVLGVGAAVSLTGCFRWEDISVYCAIGLDSARRIVDILAANRVITTTTGTTVGAVLDEIQRDFDNVRAAVQQYIEAPDSEKATRADKALLVMQTLADHIEAFWGDLKIPDPQLAATIGALLTLIVSTIRGFMVQGASEAHRPLPQRRAARAMGAARAPVPAEERSVRKFRDEFNAILEKGGYSKYNLR